MKVDILPILKRVVKNYQDRRDGWTPLNSIEVPLHKEGVDYGALGYVNLHCFFKDYTSDFDIKEKMTPSNTFFYVKEKTYFRSTNGQVVNFSKGYNDIMKTMLYIVEIFKNDSGWTNISDIISTLSKLDMSQDFKAFGYTRLRDFFFCQQNLFDVTKNTYTNFFVRIKDMAVLKRLQSFPLMPKIMLLVDIMKSPQGWASVEVISEALYNIHDDNQIVNDKSLMNYLSSSDEFDIQEKITNEISVFYVKRKESIVHMRDTTENTTLADILAQIADLIESNKGENGWTYLPLIDNDLQSTFGRYSNIMKYERLDFFFAKHSTDFDMDKKSIWGIPLYYVKNKNSEVFPEIPNMPFQNLMTLVKKYRGEKKWANFHSLGRAIYGCPVSHGDAHYLQLHVFFTKNESYFSTKKEIIDKKTILYVRENDSFNKRIKNRQIVNKIENNKTETVNNDILKSEIIENKTIETKEENEESKSAIFPIDANNIKKIVKEIIKEHREGNGWSKSFKISNSLINKGINYKQLGYPTIRNYFEAYPNDFIIKARDKGKSVFSVKIMDKDPSVIPVVVSKNNIFKNVVIRKSNTFKNIVLLIEILKDENGWTNIMHVGIFLDKMGVSRKEKRFNYPTFQEFFLSEKSLFETKVISRHILAKNEDMETLEEVKSIDFTSKIAQIANIYKESNGWTSLRKIINPLHNIHDDHQEVEYTSLRNYLYDCSEFDLWEFPIASTTTFYLRKKSSSEVPLRKNLEYLPFLPQISGLLTTNKGKSGWTCLPLISETLQNETGLDYQKWGYSTMSAFFEKHPFDFDVKKMKFNKLSVCFIKNNKEDATDEIDKEEIINNMMDIVAKQRAKEQWIDIPSIGKIIYDNNCAEKHNEMLKTFFLQNQLYFHVKEEDNNGAYHVSYVRERNNLNKTVQKYEDVLPLIINLIQINERGNKWKFLPKVSLFLEKYIPDFFDSEDFSPKDFFRSYSQYFEIKENKFSSLLFFYISVKEEDKNYLEPKKEEINTQQDLIQFIRQIKDTNGWCDLSYIGKYIYGCTPDSKSDEFLALKKMFKVHSPFFEIKEENTGGKCVISVRSKWSILDVLKKITKFINNNKNSEQSVELSLLENEIQQLDVNCVSLGYADLRDLISSYYNDFNLITKIQNGEPVYYVSIRKKTELNMELKKIVQEMAQIVTTNQQANGWTNIASLSDELISTGIDYKELGYNLLSDLFKRFPSDFEIKESSENSTSYVKCKSVLPNKAKTTGIMIKKASGNNSQDENQQTEAIKLTQWAWIHKKEALAKLKEMAMEERWHFKLQYPNHPYPILSSYLKNIFLKLSKEKKILTNEKYAAFHTGLIDKFKEPVYAVFHANQTNKKQKWLFEDFCTPGSGKTGKTLVRYFNPLPEKAHFYDDPSQLIYDIHAPQPLLDWKHIILDNVSRFPTGFLIEHLPENFVIRNPFKIGATEKSVYFHSIMQIIENESAVYEKIKNHLLDNLTFALTKVQEDIKMAVPVYYPLTDCISMLIPISLKNNDSIDLALVAEKTVSGNYLGHTIIPLDWAYNNARLIAKPDSNWLNPELIEPN
jgi:hypothetical protein